MELPKESTTVSGVEGFQEFEFGQGSRTPSLFMILGLDLGVRMEPLPVDGPSVPWAETIDYLKDVDFIPTQLDYVDDPTGLFFPSLTPVMSLQLPTPPKEEVTERPRVVSISSSFFPGSHNLTSDIVFRSADGVLFYVNAKVLLRVSRSIFEAFLGASLEDKRFRDAIIDIPESSSILNIIVHAIYGVSCAKHSPPFDDIESAVNRMPVYGLTPSAFIMPSSPLFELLLSHAPVQPIRIYALAGHFGIEALAVQTSLHLLSYDLSDLTDDLAKRMGAVYFKRLMCLHMNLLESLKTIILQPPRPHPATKACDFVEQKKLSRAWALAASYLAWDSRPDLSVHAIQSTFLALGEHLTCDQCKGVLKARIKEILRKWVTVKRTI